MTISEIRTLRESEDRVEFKECREGTFSMTGGDRVEPKRRRKCVHGYCVALANEGGGHLIFGVKEGKSRVNEIVGTKYLQGRTGQTEADLYRLLGLRVTVEELFAPDGKRVVCISVPGRPVGKVLKFEEVPLMRVGDELKPMSDDRYLHILSEREPDFSATICREIDLNDLSDKAITVLRREYADKQGNERVNAQATEALLRDLDLLTDRGLTYAALILLGTPAAIKQHLPQANLRLEWRVAEHGIQFDYRNIYTGGYLLEVARIWNEIDRHNSAVQVQRGAFVFPVYTFNEKVIREALNNAVCHRDYTMMSEVVIRQHPYGLRVTSPGGFPYGVTIENLLTVPSTPRNKLLAEVLAKLGMVERSGQGVDLIYYRCVADAKGQPDYSQSSDLHVDLAIPGLVRDEAFAAWLNQEQTSRLPSDRLSVQQVMLLEQVRTRTPRSSMNDDHLAEMVRQGLVERSGVGRGTKYRLCRHYYAFADKKGQYTLDSGMPVERLVLLVINHLERFELAAMRDFFQLLRSELTDSQTKRLIYKLRDAGVLSTTGRGKSTRYQVSQSQYDRAEVIQRAITLGLDLMRKQGELDRPNGQIVSDENTSKSQAQ